MPRELSRPPATHRLLRTAYLNGPVDIRAALKRAANERYWLTQMAAVDGEVHGPAEVSSSDNDESQGRSH
jgi:hypothetical protein